MRATDVQKSPVGLQYVVPACVDDAAASRLQLADYYRETYASKPAWQGL